jgi:recombination protein RecR
VTSLDLLIKNISRLPGIGKKSATRIVYYLLKTDRKYVESLATEILAIRDKIKTCSECGSYTESDPCGICSDPERNRKLICVVEQSQDIPVIDSTNEYNGLFHVLGGVISPIDGVGPQDLKIGKLVERIRDEGVEEIIIATNPTVEGDTTALYLLKILSDTGAKVSRLALGLPVGGDLEYADRLTLSRSLKGRTPLTF